MYFQGYRYGCIVWSMLLGILYFFMPICFAETAIVNKSEKARLGIKLVVVGQLDEQLKKTAHILKKCLELSRQCSVTVCHGSIPRNKKDVTRYSKEFAQFVIFICNCVTSQDSAAEEARKTTRRIEAHSPENGCGISFRLYDTIDANMLYGKQLSGLDVLDKRSLRGFYAFIQDLWLDLMGQEGPFSSLISYIKRSKDKGGKTVSTICVSSPDGCYHHDVMSATGAYIGLYWHPRKPCLFCSEFARFNVRLVSFDLQGKKRIILDKAGTSAGISLNTHLNKVAYCRSGSLWLYEYDVTRKKALHKKLISNEGKNMYPILCDSGDIIFCSDAQSLRENAQLAKAQHMRRRIPGIYRYSAKDNQIKPLINDSFVLAPALCSKNNYLAYAKKIAGVFQICTYNMETGEYKQLTTGFGNKIDPSWSGCGNYIVFTHQWGKHSRIAFVDRHKGERTYVTSNADYCLSPAWSYNFS